MQTQLVNKNKFNSCKTWCSQGHIELHKQYAANLFHGQSQIQDVSISSEYIVRSMHLGKVNLFSSL